MKVRGTSRLADAHAIAVEVHFHARIARIRELASLLLGTLLRRGNSSGSGRGYARSLRRGGCPLLRDCHPPSNNRAACRRCRREHARIDCLLRNRMTLRRNHRIGACHNASMLLPFLAQVSNPPIIKFPEPKPSKWYETHRFWNGIILFLSFGGWAFPMKHIIWAHIFFGAAWLCGSGLSLRMLCRDVFPRRKILAWVLLSLLLGVIVAAMDFYATHI